MWKTLIISHHHRVPKMKEEAFNENNKFKISKNYCVLNDVFPNVKCILNIHYQ